jgi:hypothetical protein
MRRTLRSRLSERSPTPDIDVLLVTWADPHTFEAHRPLDVETYYGDLPRALRDAGRRVGYLANPASWVFPFDEILANVETAADVALLPEQAVRVRDAVRIALGSLLSPAAPKQRFVIDGVDLTPILIDELRREWVKPRQLWALQFACVGHMLARRAKPSLVLHPYENQPWEKALRIGLRRTLPETEVVGIQHTPVSERWFACFPSRRDIAARAIPDLCVTIGPYWRRLFEAHGYPPETLEVAPPLRFELPALEDRVRPAESNRTVLVACSIGISDSLEIVVKAGQALDSLELTILVKLHPKMGMSQSDFARRLAQIDERTAAAVEYVGGSVADVLPRVGLVIYNTTSVSYEALAAGLPILFVSSDFSFDADPVPTHAPGHMSGSSAAEIRTAAERVLAEMPDVRHARRAAARAFLADAFSSTPSSVFYR